MFCYSETGEGLMLDSKLVIKFWCLPGQDENALNNFFTRVVDTIVDLKIGVESETDMLVLFPPDTMTYGLGTEILVEISNIPQMRYTGGGFDPARDERANDARREIVSKQIGELVKQFFPDAHVQCVVLRQALYWHSGE